MICSNCNSDLLIYHTLEDHDIPTMANKSKAIHPRCSICGYPIQYSDILDNIKETRKVLLITGTAASGKTALGQLIEARHPYVFIDGDAIQKRVNYFARRDPTTNIDYQTETLNTLLIVLALGYDAVVGYIINQETWARYVNELGKHKIIPVFRVLVPERSVCIERDVDRECWTAGELWVDKWYDEMRSYLITHNSYCIDNSHETLEETYQKHFVKLL